MKNSFLILAVLLLGFPQLGFSQNALSNEVRYEVYRVFPYISITREEIKEARTILDLDLNFESSWIREYISVELVTSYNGKKRRAVGKNATLSQEQKDHLGTADTGTEISVDVRYIPANNLKEDDIKNIHFSFTIEPDRDAEYPGGQQALKKYLKECAIDGIPDHSFQAYDLATVKFTIDEGGRVTNVHVFWPFKDEQIDTLLVDAIGNMPTWQPAAYADGTKRKQEFVLAVGNMENCLIALLNIRTD